MFRQYTSSKAGGRRGSGTEIINQAPDVRDSTSDAQRDEYVDRRANGFQ